MNNSPQDEQAPQDGREPASPAPKPNTPPRPNLLCTVCARGGSKGVRGKNIIQVAGKPLLVHTLECARRCNLFDAVVVSTDSSDIVAVAETAGVDLVIPRPAELSDDDSPKIPAVRHALLYAESHFAKKFPVIVDLDATSPLRNTEDIANCISLFLSSKAENLITASASRRSPYFNMVERIDGQIRVCKSKQRDIIRRQDAPQTYDMNASIYVWSREALLESDELFRPSTLLYEMPLERSWDIDDPLDVKIVEFFLESRDS